MIDLWLFTKLLFEVHWLYVREDRMAKSLNKDENIVRIWFLLEEDSVEIDTEWNNKNKILFNYNDILLLNMDIMIMIICIILTNKLETFDKSQWPILLQQKLDFNVSVYIF